MYNSREIVFQGHDRKYKGVPVRVDHLRVYSFRKDLLAVSSLRRDLTNSHLGVSSSGRELTLDSLAFNGSL